MAKNVFCEVKETLTFDHWPPESNLFITESKWTFLLDLKKFPQGGEGDIVSQELDKIR